MTISPGAVVRACTFGAFIAALLVVIDGPSPLVFDAAGYWELGTSVAQGDWLLRSHSIAYRTPGYPWLIGVCQLISGQYALLTLLIVQAAMSAACVAMAAEIAKRIAPAGVERTASAVSAVVMFLFVSRLFWTRAVLGETLFIFSLLTHLLCVLIWLQNSKSLAWGAVVGVTFALMVLVRPVGQWLWIAHLIWILPALQNRCPIFKCLWKQFDSPKLKSEMLTNKNALVAVLMAVAITGLCLGPWYYRNLQMFGRPFLTEFLGRNIWIVTFQDQAGAGLPLPNTEEATSLLALAESSSEKPVDMIKTWEVSRLLTSSGVEDDETDRRMRKIAFQAIVESPVEWTERSVRRFVNFFRCVPDSYPKYVDESSFPQSQFVWGGHDWGSRVIERACLAPNIVFGSVFACLYWIANGVLIAFKPYRLAGLWLAAMIGYFALITALVEIPDYRYRMVVEPLQAIVFGLGVSVICQRWVRRGIQSDNKQSP